MSYSGKFKVKNLSKYKGDFDNVIYRSLWERHVFKWCDENPNVKQWSSEEIIVPYFYEADKRYHIAEGFTYIKNMNKWEAAENFCKDRGWEFQIWTEKTLQEMKLLPKTMPGKLKPLKRFRPYKRKRKK